MATGSITNLRSGPNIPVVIICGCVIALLSFGPRSAMGLFFQPMTEARDWSRELFALAIAIQNLMWGVGQPIAGMFADRWGTWKAVSVGAVFYAAGLFFMADAQSAVALHVTGGVLIGLGVAFTSFSIVLAAFGRIVSPEQRSWAFGICTASSSLGQFLFAPFGMSLIETFGWQSALMFFALLMIIIPFVGAAIAGKPGPQKGEDPTVADQPMMAALSEAFATPSYVLLVIGFFVCGFHLAFVTVHLPSYIVDVGLDPKWGATALALVGLANIVGCLAAGYLSGRYPKQLLLALMYIARSAIILLFIIFPPSPLTVMLFAGTMGLLWLSTVPPTSGLIAVMFGPRYMATLFGFAFLSHQVGGFLGVWLGGRLYDETGSYDIIWWCSIALGLFAAVLHWPIQDKPVQRLNNAAPAE